MAIAMSAYPRPPTQRAVGTSQDSAKLLLRLTLGLLMLLHGIDKVTGGIDPIMGLVAKAGLPAALGYGVYVGELLAPLLLIVGAWTRAAAIVIAFNMVVAIAIAQLGAGRYSAGGVDGRWN